MEGDISTFINILPPFVCFIYTQDLNLLCSTSTSFVCRHYEICQLLLSIASFCFFIKFILRLILIMNGLLTRDTANCGLRVAKETTDLGFTFFVKWIMNMELAVEVLYAINYALMFARSSLLSFKVPFNTYPNFVSCLGVVNQLSDKSNGACMLSMLCSGILIQEMFLLVWILNSNSLSYQMSITGDCSWHLLSRTYVDFHFHIHLCLFCF